MLGEDAFLDFQCPRCGELNSFPGDAAGLVRECVHCSESILVPADGSKVGRAIPLPIHTERLTLRRFVAGDWKELMGFMFEEEHEASAWLERQSQARLSNLHEHFHLAIEDRDSSRIIGEVTLQHGDAAFREMEIHFELNDRAAGERVAEEAIKGLLGFCFEALRLHRVTARSVGVEAARCEALQKAGMRREGEFVKNAFWDGRWTNTAWFAMLDEEFVATPGSESSATPT